MNANWNLTRNLRTAVVCAIPLMLAVSPPHRSIGAGFREQCWTHRRPRSPEPGSLTNLGAGVSRATETNPAGHYLFDLAEPARYSLAVTAQGFAEFRAPSVLLQQRGDVTVDAALNVGGVLQEVNVIAAAAQVQFDSPKLETTVDNQVAANVPQFFRAPFFLSKLDPSVVQSETRIESQPYHSTGTGTQQVVGVNSMDLQVDGAPVGLGTFTGYVPAPDMVSEVNVQVNSVDAEFGQSTGAAISVTMKAGTNETHGSAFYQDVYPWANAVLNRINRTENVQRNHMFGGTIGHPIRKNRWFNFAAFEGWQLTDPQIVVGQLPTARELSGDYGQSLNQRGSLRMIYDPWSTQTSADGSTVTRTPFPSNIIPAGSIGRVAAAYAAALPQPNQPGIGPYNARNYVVPLRLFTPYRNFSDRTDYVINDRLRYTGRASFFHTPIAATNPIGSAFQSGDSVTQFPVVLLQAIVPFVLGDQV